MYNFVVVVGQDAVQAVLLGVISSPRQDMVIMLILLDLVGLVVGNWEIHCVKQVLKAIHCGSDAVIVDRKCVVLREIRCDFDIVVVDERCTVWEVH